MTNDCLRNLKNLDHTLHIQKIQTEVDTICKIIIHSAKYKNTQSCSIPVNDYELYKNNSQEILHKLKDMFPECIVFLKPLEVTIDWSK